MVSEFPGWANALFLLGISLVLAHELDAMRAREWRLLFVLRRMPEEHARKAFVLVHVPLVAGLIWLCTHPALEVRLASQIAFNLFLIVHAGLHWRLSGHALYDFHNKVSRGLIVGAALVGALHLSVIAALLA
jgi:hypothetical protein